ncbi:MAG: rod shape-determining protein MreD [Kangiellaceae bacterium]|nr:rod shape-determining protein MreD [Kangiellaceae bacterium]
MKTKSKHASWVIYLSLIIALILSIFPLPEAWQAYRPSWLLLVVSYWAIALSYRFGLLWAFVWGLMLDALLGTTLGLHSFALCVVVFIVHLNHKRIRLFPHWKQALTMGSLSVLYLAIVLWLSRLTGKPAPDWDYWFAALINAVLWPWLFILLRDLRRYFKVV